MVIAAEEGELCRIRMEDLRRCDATMLKFDALLVPGEEDAAPALLRYGVRIRFRRWRGHSPATGRRRCRAGRACGGSFAPHST